MSSETGNTGDVEQSRLSVISLMFIKIRGQDVILDDVRFSVIGVQTELKCKFILN